MKKSNLLWVLLWLAVSTSLSAQGSFTVTGGASVKIAGAAHLQLHNTHWNNSGNFTAGGSTVEFSGTLGGGAQIAGAGADVFHHLKVNRGSGNVSLEKNIAVAGSLQFSAGLLNLNGHDLTLQQPNGTLSGETETSRITSTASGEVIRTASLNAPGQAEPGELGAVLSSAANLGTTTLKRGHQPQAGACNSGIRRYFILQPANNSGLNATLRLYYADAELNGIPESDLTLYRSDDGGVTWTDAGFDTRNATENWVEKTGIASLSRWTIGATSQWLSPKMWWKDADGDGYTDGASQTACAAPPDYVAAATAGDCNDANAAVNPAATDVCEDHIDNDCNGLFDDGCPVFFAGTIAWSNDGVTGVQNATVSLTGAGAGNDGSDINGEYLIAMPYLTGNFTLKPAKNINRLNGVTVADVLAIQQHVSMVNPITDPYKLVAADINRNNAISSLDATVLNQSLLGNPSANNIFNKYWRFVPQSYNLPAPPWGFPEQINLNNVLWSQYNQDFFGIKIGDVVATYANPANFGAETPGLVLRVRDRTLRAGESFDVVFSADALNDLAAFQLGLRYDPAQLHFGGVEPLHALPMSLEHFGTENSADGEIRVVWSQPAGAMLSAPAPLFRLRFTALQSGKPLHTVLHAAEEVLPALCYSGALKEAKVAVQFNTLHVAADRNTGDAGLQLLPNRPNPFSGATTIGFVLPQACEAQLRVLDVNGAEIWRLNKSWPAGYQEEIWQTPGAAGVLYVELTTPWGVTGRKILRVDK